MSVVVEQSGAQVLPDVRDQRAEVTAWFAHLAADADLRTRSPLFRELAERLEVHP